MTAPRTPARVVLADTTAPDYKVEAALFAERADVEPVYLRTRDPGEVVAAAHDADALILAWAPITADVVARLERCRVIVRYGIGVDMIDLAAATEHGIVVCNTARYCLDEVSTHAIGLLLALNRRIPLLDRTIRGGGWSAAGATAPRRLAGQRLGLIGFGNIGRRVAAKAVALGLEVVAFDPVLGKGASEIDGVPLLSLEQTLSTADYVSLHCPLTASTRRMIGARQIAMMKPEAFFINTARGAIVDQAALVDALASGAIAGAGLDVYESEPLAADDPLRGFENVVLTPHWAHSSIESSIECRRIAVEHVLTALDGAVPQDVVNREVLERGPRLLSTNGAP